VTYHCYGSPPHVLVLDREYRQSQEDEEDRYKGQGDWELWHGVMDVDEGVNQNKRNEKIDFQLEQNQKNLRW
jgi:hypothetical protein